MSVVRLGVNNDHVKAREEAMNTAKPRGGIDWHGNQGEHNQASQKNVIQLQLQL